jgi:hypothetical protein
MDTDNAKDFLTTLSELSASAITLGHRGPTAAWAGNAH